MNKPIRPRVILSKTSAETLRELNAIAKKINAIVYIGIDDKNKPYYHISKDMGVHMEYTHAYSRDEVLEHLVSMASISLGV